MWEKFSLRLKVAGAFLLAAFPSLLTKHPAVAEMGSIDKGDSRSELNTVKKKTRQNNTVMKPNFMMPKNCTFSMLFRFGLLLLFAFSAVVGPQSSAWAGAADTRSRVQTKEGFIEGLRKNDSQVFLGIPYAAPPTGERRWQPPHDVERWTDTRSAKAFCPACPQPVLDYMIPTDQPPEEDCLCLNISAPIGAADLPVLVMIHGGGFVSGSGEYIFALAPLLNAEDVILVTFNYRLGSLGFFAHPELEAEQGVNFALMDMIAALRWIKRNIAAFGGDPKKVTALGVSAGAMSVELLMSSPAAAGLISGGIAQSGYGAWPRQPRTGDVAPLANAPSAESMALELGSQVTGKPADKVTREDLYAVTPEQWSNTVRGFHLPIVDGISLLEETAILFALGKQHPIPFISGGTSFDGSVFGISGVSGEDLLDMTDGRVERMRELWVKDFAVSEDLGMQRFFGDLRYVYSALNMTRSMEKVGRPGYLYMFEYVPPDQRDKVPGAAHAADAETMWTKFNLPIAEAMRAYWINFVKTGNPNGEGLTPWPQAAESDSTRWIAFGDAVVQKDDIHAEKMAFIDNLWRARVAPLLAPQPSK